MLGLEVLPFPRVRPRSPQAVLPFPAQVPWQSVPCVPGAQPGCAPIPRAAAACGGSSAVQSPLLPSGGRGGRAQPVDSGVWGVRGATTSWGEVSGVMLLPSSSAGRAGDQLRADLNLLLG